MMSTNQPTTDPALHLHPSQPLHVKVTDTLVGLVIGAALGPFVHELIGRHSERLAKRARTTQQRVVRSSARHRPLTGRH